MPTELRKVLEAIGYKATAVTTEKDAVGLLDTQLRLVQACQHTDPLSDLVKVRDSAKQALKATFNVRTESVLARSHAEPLEQALGPLERLIEKIQTQDKPEKERFEQRWKVQGRRVDGLLTTIDLIKGNWPGPSVTQAAQAFSKSVDALKTAREDEDFPEANQVLDQVEKDLEAFDAVYEEFREQDKEEYLKLEPALRKIREALEPAIAGHKLGTPPTGEFAKAIELHQTTTQALDEALARDDYWYARSRAKAYNKMVPLALSTGLQDLKNDLTGRIERAQKLFDGMAAGAFPGVDDKPLKAALTAANKGLAKAGTYDCADALASLQPLDDAVKVARSSAVQGLLKGGDKTPRAARAKAAAMVKHDPEAMIALADEPGGKALLDAMVNDLGGKAKDGDSKAFVRAAITARFGPKLTDQDLTTKYLPRLYKVLGMMPESHTLDNEKLATINRKRTKLETSGDYGGGNINLKAPRTGIGDALVSFGAWALPKKLIGKQLPGGVSQFDALTLHEVGHAVDDKKSFMDGKAGNVTFGGWQKHTVEDVAALLVDAKGLASDFPDLGKPFLRAYLVAVLQKKKPQDTAEVTGAIPGGVTPNWKTLAKHAATDHAESIRMRGTSKGLWDQGDSGATKYAIGSSVYQESYGGKWVSYALSARSAKVTDYQFRADGEWYAEAYAAFFLGKLKESHPLHPILTKDKESTVAAKRAAR